MTGYESIMLFCQVGTFIVTLATFVLEIIKALDKKENKSK